MANTKGQVEQSPYATDISPLDRWGSIPIAPDKKSIQLIDMTLRIAVIEDPDDPKTQLVFPKVPRGEERIEVQWIWIYGKPKYGKTTKGKSLINYALKSRRYDLNKTQIMEGEDLNPMMDEIKRGTEVVILHINDAHQHQSTFAMASYQGREHADVTFLARHIFKQQSGLPYGILIIIANAQEFRSINKWIRDQAVMMCYCGNIAEDDNIARMPPAYKGLLGRITTQVEEYKDQKFKSDMVVILPHRLTGNVSMSEYNDPEKSPYGLVHLDPLKRVCYEPGCNTIFRKFLLKCPACGSSNVKEVLEYPYLDSKTSTERVKLFPYDQVVRQIEGKTTARITFEQMELREKVIDKLYSGMLEENINPLKQRQEFLNTLVYRAKDWLNNEDEDLQMRDIKIFEKEMKKIYHSLLGRYKADKGISPDEGEMEVEEIDFSSGGKKRDTFTSVRYVPDLIGTLNKMIQEGNVQDLRHAKIFKEFYFEKKTGEFIKNPENRPKAADLAYKYKLQRSWINNIISPNRKGSIFAALLRRVGHEYEDWVAKHLSMYNALPYLNYDGHRKVILCGGQGEPDVIVGGTRDGKDVIDIISCKLTLFWTEKSYRTDVSHPDHCAIAPEAKTYSSFRKQGFAEVTRIDGTPIKISCSTDQEINIIMLVRNSFYDEMELMYRWGRLKDIPKNLTVSKDQYDKLKEQRVHWRPI